MGDDLPDLELIQLAGLGIAPSNATAYVKQNADWITLMHVGDIMHVGEAVPKVLPSSTIAEALVILLSMKLQ